jgi:hypothetical protein
MSRRNYSSGKRLSSFENSFPSPDRSGNPFVSRFFNETQKIAADSGNSSLLKQNSLFLNSNSKPEKGLRLRSADNGYLNLK